MNKCGFCNGNGYCSHCGGTGILLLIVYAIINKYAKKKEKENEISANA